MSGKNEIDENLEAADLIILLISSDLLDSDECFHTEMTRVIAQHDTGLSRVIAIIILNTDC